jgi:biotin synthase
MSEQQTISITTTPIWDYEKVVALFAEPFADLLYRAHQVHRAHHDPNAVQISCLLSIKTGACPENCAYCPQSAHYDTGVAVEKLWSKENVLEKARNAKANGASRFCMGASWRDLPDRELPKILEIVQEVKALGMETCVTLGMVTGEQAQALKAAGLDYYNHNLDSSKEYYEKIITTRTYEERLQTIAHVHKAGINICCGGIMGMGETAQDRIEFLLQLTRLADIPSSIPINRLIAVAGTPLAEQEEFPAIEFARMIAVTRIMFPKSAVRLSAGRKDMSEELQALCFFAGANSIHTGEKLLTTELNGFDSDAEMFARLGIKPLIPESIQTGDESAVAA